MASSSSADGGPGAITPYSYDQYSEYNKWDTGVQTVRQRFKGIDGRILQEVVRKAYLTDETVNLPFYGPKGERLLFRHSLNADRSQAHTVERYANIIAEKGLMVGASSEAIAMINTSRYPGLVSYDFLAAANRVEAIYRAAEKFPNNKLVTFTLGQGMVASLLDPRCPKDIS
eukprot:3418936-Alexandrium_andersonii.AAC.1